jgi:hypothetical protein
MIEEASGFHARALRVIGQDLAALVPENVVIELDGNDFVARGLSTKSRVEEQSATGAKKFFTRLKAVLFRAPTKGPDLEFVPFMRTYNLADIERLDRERTKQRDDAGGMPDIYTLGERLRTIGKVIDAQNGRIVRIFKDLHQIVFEYQDGAGQTCKEQLNNTELYQLQQRYAAERVSAHVPDAMAESQSTQKPQ